MQEVPNKLVAGWLGIFLGSLGVHQFYVGRNGVGLAMIIPSVFLCWTFVVPFFVGMIGLVQGILWLTTDEDTWRKSFGAAPLAKDTQATA